jgi:hypothetical protein
MASKQTKKITKAPSGVSFMYEPKQPNDYTLCPDCKDGELRTTVRKDGFLVFVCTDCDWVSPSGEFQHEPTKRTILPRKLPVVKKQAQKKQPRELCDAVRVEARKRMARLVKAREAMKKPSSKLTPAERDKLHKLSFSIVEIREELKGV